MHFIHLENLDTINVNKENWELLFVIMKHIWKELELLRLEKWGVIIAVFDCFQSHRMEERLILFCVISGSRTSTAVLN